MHQMIMLLKNGVLVELSSQKNTLQLKNHIKLCLSPPSKILQSDKAVCQDMRVLIEEYINPFDVAIQKNDLLNLLVLAYHFRVTKF